MSERVPLVVLSSSREEDQIRSERLKRTARIDALGVDRRLFALMPCFRMSPEAERGEERVERWKRQDSQWMSEAWLRWINSRERAL